MRTTLTLDDDVLALVHEAVHRARRTMKSVVNDALRHSLGAHPSARAYSVTPHDAPLQPGIDPGRLNQLADELEDDAIVAGWRV